MKVYLSIFPLELSETFPWTTERVVRGEGLDMNNDGRQCHDCSLDETSQTLVRHTVTQSHSHTVSLGPWSHCQATESQRQIFCMLVVVLVTGTKLVE